MFPRYQCNKLSTGFCQVRLFIVYFSASHIIRSNLFPSESIITSELVQKCATDWLNVSRSAKPRDYIRAFLVSTAVLISWQSCVVSCSCVAWIIPELTAVRVLDVHLFSIATYLSFIFKHPNYYWSNGFIYFVFHLYNLYVSHRLILTSHRLILNLNCSVNNDAVLPDHENCGALITEEIPTDTQRLGGPALFCPYLTMFSALS